MVYGNQANKGDPKHAKITNLFRIALGTQDLAALELVELNKVFEPDNDLQQIRYKRSFGTILRSKRDFVILKGQVGQSEHDVENKQKLVMNTEIGFKCLHYSITESSGVVRVAIENFLGKPQTVGCKTKGDTAVEDDDFVPLDVHVTIPGKSTKSVEIEIINDDGWEPDEDFFVYLYNIGDENKN